MSSLNKIILIGRMTKQPELRYTTTNNLPVVSFTLAVNRSYGEKIADFINCSAWRKTAENVHKYCDNGSLVAVDGRIQTSSYQDEKNNITRYKTEVVCDSVVFLPSNTDKVESAEQPKEEIPNNAPPTELDLPF